MSTLKVTTIQDASGGNTATINSMTPTADSLQGFRNRIINGDMRIDQRNAGAEINPAVDATYYLDRWKVTSGAASKFKIGQNAGSVTPPTGFSNYLGCTSLSAYSVGATETFNITQVIEGFNFADMAWGTANAKTVTLSFWVRSSLTGTFGGSLRNSAVDRSYPFSYTISAANTWEQKTVTITGDTSGTWIGSTNGIGVLIGFSLGSGSSRVTTAGAWAASNYTGVTGQTNVVGTNGATFYITGVQLEVGSVATPFERRDYGRELALCQRYYFRIKPGSPGYYTTLFSYVTNSDSYGGVSFPVPMRIAPTALEQTGTASDYSQAFVGAGGACTGVPVFTAGTTVNVGLIKSVASSGHTAGQAGYMYASNSNSYLAWSAEL